MSTVSNVSNVSTAVGPRRLRTLVASLLTGALLASLATLPAAADDLDDQRRRAEQRAQQNQQALEDLHEHLEDTDAELLATQTELEAIEAQIPVAEQALAEAEARLAELEREAEILAQRLAAAQAKEAELAARIAEDEARVEGLRAAVGQLARDAYKGDIMASSLTTILDATSTADFVEQSALTATAMRTQTQALRELEQVQGANRNRQVRLEAVRAEVAALKAEADAKVAEAEQVRAEAEARKEELEALRADRAEKLAQIEARREEQLAKKAELEAAQKQLEADLKAVIAKQQERDAAARRARDEALRREAESSGGGGSSGALLSWPVPAPVVITSNYGYRIHPIYGYRKLHAGTDFRAYCGNPIIAAASGTVVWTAARGGYGNQVMLDHGTVGGKSLMTSYNHLSRYAVKAGQSVSRGQVVGYSGTTGTSTACHLHFEVYRNGVTVNPRDWL